MTSLSLALLLGTPAFALDSGDIVVASVKGEVRVTMNGALRDVRAGSVLELPASVRTGRDGAIELKQGATSVSVGPETELEFPALEKRGAPVDRIVQPRGNAFYDIGKREGRKLRVETPYLVGVIKGTQFNVAAQDDSTTISLFEGRLEIRATDDSEVVDLNAGEIASRRRGDKSISVVKMNEKAPTTAPRSQTQNGGDGSQGADQPLALAPVRGAPATTNDDAQLPSSVAGRPDITVSDSLSIAQPSAGVDVTAGVNAGVGVVAGVDVEVGNGVRVDAATNPPVDVGPVGVDTDVRASVDVGGGAASVDVGVSAGVDLGTAVTVDAGANASVDLGTNGVSVDVGAAVDLTAGAITTSVDTGAAVDLGPGGVSVDVDAGIAAGVGDVAAVDTGANLTADLGAGGIDVGAAVDVGANVAGVDAGVTAGVDVGAGSIDLGVTLGNLDLDLGVDLGLDDGNNGGGDDSSGTDPSNPGNDTTAPGNIVDDVRGLLDGLLRRPGRK